MAVHTIQSLNSNGQGVTKIDGLVTFVDGASPGDLVELRIIERKRSYQVAEIETLVEPSSDRVMAHLSASERCGGCSLDHLSYPAQLSWKTETVKDQLIRIGGLEPDQVDTLCKPCLPSPSIWHYRNKVSFPIGGTSEEPEIGFYEPRSHRIVDQDVCHAQPPISNAIRTLLREWIQGNRIEPYDEETHSGLLRHAVMRIGFRTKEVMLILVVNQTTMPELPYDSLLSTTGQLCAEMGYEFKSFYINYQAARSNLILGRDFRLVWGAEAIREIILDTTYRISPGAFFQINSEQTERLYTEAIRALELDGTEQVFDLYCGTGSITLQLSKYAKEVTGIELYAAAIEDAKRNAEANGITNADFLVGAAERVVPKLYEAGKRADAIVVDPPRKGLDTKLIDTMLAMQAEKIVYVSCNPATLARDLKLLLADGDYEIRHIQPVDMFPATSHVETVVLMSRVKE